MLFENDTQPSSRKVYEVTDDVYSNRDNQQKGRSISERLSFIREESMEDSMKNGEVGSNSYHQMQKQMASTSSSRCTFHSESLEERDEASSFSNKIQSKKMDSSKSLGQLMLHKENKKSDDLLSLKDRISIMKVVADHKVQESSKNRLTKQKRLTKRCHQPFDDHGSDKRSIAGSIGSSIAGSTSSLRKMVKSASKRFRRKKKQKHADSRGANIDLPTKGHGSLLNECEEDFFDCLEDALPEDRPNIDTNNSTKNGSESSRHLCAPSNNQDPSVCSEASSVSMLSLGTGSISSLTWGKDQSVKGPNGGGEVIDRFHITFEPSNLTVSKLRKSKIQSEEENMRKERRRNFVKEGSILSEANSKASSSTSQRSQSTMGHDFGNNSSGKYFVSTASLLGRSNSLSNINSSSKESWLQSKRSSSGSLRSLQLHADTANNGSSRSLDAPSVSSNPETSRSQLHSRPNQAFLSKFESQDAIPTIMEDVLYQNRDNDLSMRESKRRPSLSLVKRNNESNNSFTLRNNKMDDLFRRKHKTNDPVSELDILLEETLNLNKSMKPKATRRQSIFMRNESSCSSDIPIDRHHQLENSDKSLGIRPTISRDKSHSTKSSSGDDSMSPAIYRYIKSTPAGRTVKKYAKVRQELKGDDFDEYFEEIYHPFVENNNVYRENQNALDKKMTSKYGSSLSDWLSNANSSNSSSTSVNYRGSLSRNRYEDDTKTLLRLRLKSIETELAKKLRQKYGFPNGLAKELHRFSAHQLILRFWIVDNSGSMATGDGRKYSAGTKKSLRKSVSSGLTRDVGCVNQMINCTRWEELRDSVLYHGELASDLNAPTIFRLVNDPNIARKQYMIEEGLSLEEYDALSQVVGVCARSVPTRQKKSLISLEKHRFLSLNQSHLRKAFMLHTRHSASTDSDHEPREWEGNWALDYGLYDSFDDDWKIRAKDDYETLRHVMYETDPRYKTPLSGQIWAVFDQVVALQNHLREGQKITIVIATDGVPDDHEAFLDAVRSVGKLPICLIVRLCTDDLAAMHFWNTLDLDVGIPVEVLDDFEAEASAVNSMNPWLNYCIPIQRLREWGYINPLVEKLREEPLSYDDLRDFCALLFGVPANSLPHPKEDWDTFFYDIEALNYREPTQWNPLSRNEKKWIDMKKLAKLYGGSREKARQKKLKKLRRTAEMLEQFK